MYLLERKFRNSYHELAWTSLRDVGVFYRSNSYLNSLTPINLEQLISRIISSRQAICIVDPVPAKLFNVAQSLINIFLLDMIHSSQITGYITQSLKIAVNKPHLQKPTLEALTNYRPTSHFLSMSKILEKLVRKQ